MVMEERSKPRVATIYYLECSVFNNSKNKTYKEKWKYCLNQSKKTDKTAPYRKSCSMSLIIREMSITTAVRHYLIPVRMNIIKNINDKYQQGCGAKRPLVHSWWECKLV